MSIGITSQHARALRRNATDVERAAWQHLRNRQLGGLKFRQQASVSGYIADFLCAEKRLIVEFDGGQHSDAIDRVRTARLSSLGYRVIRFWNHEWRENSAGVLQVILDVADSLPSRFGRRQPSSNCD
jgi:very-short-patch-repair endonuclease